MSKSLQGTVNLPGSKSESNRALMIGAYGGFLPEVEGLSDAHDTVLLKQLLEHTSLRAEHSGARQSTIDCEDAGTVARFLLTYLACKPGNWILTGTERLCQRPIAPLIDALRRLGADIKGESLPLQINGKPLKGGSVTLDASQSSQFASSLLMAAPTWELGLKLKLKGNPVSMPYLGMTIKIMEHYGVQVIREGNTITVPRQSYQPRPFKVDADWSSASYWYEMMALSQEGELLLKGLVANGLQGDASVADMFSEIGVKTEFLENGARVSKVKTGLKSIPEPLVFDFNNTPDLFPSVFVTCVALHIDAVFNGISTLSKKESDRINSIIIELSKIYTFINIVSDDMIIIKKSSVSNKEYNIKNVVFNTYHDHRIAMALAALAPKIGWVRIDNPTIVNKSYPAFWDELKKFM